MSHLPRSFRPSLEQLEDRSAPSGVVGADAQFFGIGPGFQLVWNDGLLYHPTGVTGVDLAVGNRGDGDRLNDIVYLRGLDNQLYTYDHPGRAVEAVTARIRAIAPLEKIDLAAPSEAETFASVYIPEGWQSRGDATGNLILTKP